MSKDRTGQQTSIDDTTATVQTAEPARITALRVRGVGAAATTLGDVLASAGLDGCEVEVTTGRWVPIEGLDYGQLLEARRAGTATF